MITAAVVLAGVAVAAGLALLPRRLTLHPSALGTMSATWLAEERASESNRL